MPESRDRLPRQDNDIIASYSQRRIARTGGMNVGRGNSIAFVLEDDHEEEQAAMTPFRWRDMSLAGSPGLIGVAARGAVGTPRIRPAQNLSPVVRNGFNRGGAFRTPSIRRVAPLRGTENLSPVMGGGRGLGRGGVLPTWYPRRPLNDITAVVRAIERRRERRGEGDGLQNESPVPQDRTSDDHASTPSARLDHNLTMISPLSTFSNKCCLPSMGNVSKILLNITHKNIGDAAEACLTPQKKLLNSIDTVEKVVMEELRKLKRTPSAKKAEREKRVRTLMSMR